MAPLDAPTQPPEETPAVEKQPDWSRRLREEIRQNLVEGLARSGKGGPGSNKTGVGQPARKSRVLQVVRDPEKTQHRANLALFFPGIRPKIPVSPASEVKMESLRRKSGL